MFIQPDWLDSTEAGAGTNRYTDSNIDPIDRMDANGIFWGLAVKLVKVALKGGDISLTVAGIVQDAKVLMDSNASVSDRAIAAASLASEVISPTNLRDAKAMKKAVEGKPSVPGGTPGVPTVSRATNRGLCSFHGDTLVLTDAGLLPIRDVNTEMSVWSRNPANGAMSMKPVQAQYSNPYDETVSVSMRDVETGIEQTIVSNRIHPYFVQTTREVTNSSEGHVYEGPLENGHWVDATELQAGDRLLNDDGTWAEIVGVEIEAKPLTAFNLTVAEFHTYFVAGNENSSPIWVHNDCVSTVNWKGFDKGLAAKQKYHWADLNVKNSQEYVNAARDFANKPVGNGVVAHAVGPFNIKIDTNSGLVFVGNKSGKIRTFYKDDGRGSGDLVADVLKKAAEKAF